MIGKKRGLFGARREPPPMPPIELPKPTFKMDVVGPTVDDDVIRIIARYGEAEVKAAMARRTKRGRKPLADWPELGPIIEEDARIWLSGRDPFDERSNYAIAQVMASENPGHSREATHRRIMRKLAERREQLTVVRAFSMSDADYPYIVHLKALKALIAFETHEVYLKILARKEARIAEYEVKFGTVPEDMSMEQVERESLKTIPVSLPEPNRLNDGIGGLLGRYLNQVNG